MAYFQLLHAIKHSEFLSHTTSGGILQPTLAMRRDGMWWAEGVDDVVIAEEAVKVEIQQLVISLDMNTFTEPLAYSLASPPFDSAISSLTQHLTDASYSAACYTAPGEDTCFTSASSSTHSTTLNLAFVPGHNLSSWSSSLRGKKFNYDDIHFAVDEQTQRIDEMQSITWVGYAGKALVTRFWSLARKADSADIIVVLLGYVVMHVIAINVFLKTRKLGSNFWLGAFSTFLRLWLLFARLY